jgi:hypothetical protein
MLFVWKNYVAVFLTIGLIFMTFGPVLRAQKKRKILEKD